MQVDINRWWAKTQFSDSVRLRMYRKIAKMLSNGLPLLKILEELRDRASEQGAKPNDPLAIVLDDCRRMVQNGRLLSDALEWWVPKTEQMILMAGEQSGRLEVTLVAVIDVVSAGRDPVTGKNRPTRLELVRLTIPRRVYTQAHMDVVAESVVDVFDRRKDVHGLAFTYEPEYLRFFQARFAPVGGAKLIEASESEAGAATGD